jgi:hypothetical protein
VTVCNGSGIGSSSGTDGEGDEPASWSRNASAPPEASRLGCARDVMYFVPSGRRTVLACGGPDALGIFGDQGLALPVRGNTRSTSRSPRSARAVVKDDVHLFIYFF